MTNEFLTIQEIRLKNTRSLMRSLNIDRAEFADSIGMSYNLLSQYIGKNPTKNIGDETAEKIEKFFGRSRGFLDQEVNIVESEKSNSRSISLERQDDAKRLRDIWENFKTKAQLTNIKISQEDVADACGWTQGAFNAYLNCRTPLNLEALLKLSHQMGVSPNQISPSLASLLMQDSGSSLSQIPSKVLRIPIRTITKAGIESNISTANIYVENTNFFKDCYACEILDSALSPFFNIGDFVIIKPNSNPSPGDFVLASNGKAWFVRKYQQVGINNAGGNVYRLVPLNIDYPEFYSDRENLNILGVIFEHRRTIKNL